MTALIIGLVLGVPFVLAVYGFFFYLGETRANNTVTRQTKLTRYNPDHLGNYPAYFNPKTGTYFVPTPGNRAYPEQFLPVAVNFKQVHEQDRPLVINYGGSRAPELPLPGEPRAPELPLPGEPTPQEIEFKELPQLEGARTLDDIQALLAQDKREGRYMEDSIRERTGLKAKSGKSFRKWVDYWNSLEGETTNV